MHLKLRLTVAAAVLALASPALATNGMRMIGFGPVQNSMGGVSVGAPLDAAVVITNPSGISFTGGRIDFGASYFDATVKYKAEGPAGFPPGMIASGQEQESTRRASPIPAFGLVIPGPENLTFGIGAYGVSGIGVDYPQDLYGGKTFTSYSEMRFAPGLSYKILPNLSVGAVANVMYSTMEYTAGGIPPRDMAIAYGAGATIGLTYQPIETVTVGAAYETRSFFQDYEFNIPAHTRMVGVDPGTGAPIMMDFGPGVEKLDFDQPSSFTAGVGFRPVKGLLLAADVGYILWSETNGKDQPEYQTPQGGPGGTGYTPFNLNWEDQLVYKVGVEYAAAPWLKLRAGWNYGKQPLDETRAFETIAFPAIAEHHYTAGLGFELGKAAINLGGMYAPEVKLSGSNPGLPPAGQMIGSYETSLSEWSLEGGVSYRF